MATMLRISPVSLVASFGRLAVAATIALALGGCAHGDKDDSGSGKPNPAAGRIVLNGTWAIDAKKTKGNGGDLDSETRKALGTITYVFHVGGGKDDNPLSDQYDGYFIVERGKQDTGDFGAFKHVGLQGKQDVYTMFIGHRNKGPGVSPGGELTIDGGAATWSPKIGNFAGMELVLHKR